MMRMLQSQVDWWESPRGEGGAGRVAFAALIAFTFVLLLAPQSTYPTLASLHLAAVAAGLAIAALPARRATAAISASVGPSNYSLVVDGEAAGPIWSFSPPSYEVASSSGTAKATGPKFGEFSIRVSLAQSGKLWTILDSVMKKTAKAFNLAVVLSDQNGKAKRRVEMTNIHERCMRSAIELELEQMDERRHVFR